MTVKRCANCDCVVKPWCDFCTVGCVGLYARKVGKTEQQVLREFIERRDALDSTVESC